MPRMGHSNPRTYGSKLLNPKPKETTSRFPVTTRTFDIDHFNRTGEVKYLDEEGATMTTVDQRANGKRMRMEITSLEQFEAIGHYSVVAKKYQVGKAAAHALLQSLRSKKAKEEKQVDVKHAAGTCIPEIEETANIPSSEKSFTPGEVEVAREDDCAKGGNLEEIPETNARFALTPEGMTEARRIIEACRVTNDVPSELQDEAVDTILGKIAKATTCYTCSDCGEHVNGFGEYSQSGLCRECYINLGKYVEMTEGSRDNRHQPIEDEVIQKLWNDLEEDTEIIRKIYIQRAENEFKDRLSRLSTLDLPF